MHTSAAHPLGEFGGEANHQLTVNEMPAHTHTVHAGSAAASLVSPSDAAWADSSPQSLYAAGAEHHHAQHRDRDRRAVRNRTTTCRPTSS